MGKSHKDQLKELQETLVERDERLKQLEEENKAKAEELKAKEAELASAAEAAPAQETNVVTPVEADTDAVESEIDKAGGEVDLQELVARQEATTELRRGSEPSGRPRRTPISTRDILTAPHRPGYKRRFVLNSEGRVAQLFEHGYKIVTGDVQVGSGGLKDTKIGTPVTAPAGNGKRMVLMEIREDWHNEDQAEKQRLISENESGMFDKANNSEEFVGSVTSR